MTLSDSLKVRPTSVTLSLAQRGRLETIAAGFGVSRSWLIRALIEQFLDMPPEARPQLLLRGRQGGAM